MEKSILKEIGLTGSEEKVYYSLIKLQSSTTGPIIKEAGINHSKIYLILRKLEDKGLATSIIKNKSKYYSATDPENLLDYVKIKKEQISKQEKQIEKLVPELRIQMNSNSIVPEATTFYGFKGLKSALNFILKKLHKGEEYQVLTLENETQSKDVELFLKNYHQKRIEKGVLVRLLTMKKDEEKTKKKFPEYPLSKRKFIDVKFPNGIFIFEDHILHFIWGENPTAFLIKSKEIYSRHKDFFEDLWKLAED